MLRLQEPALWEYSAKTNNMTTQTVNFLIAIFGVSVAGISALIYRDSKGRVAGSAHWIAANLCDFVDAAIRIKLWEL
ncbi:hypothetical protein K7J14_05105 [Treponema zuelzerae]|uniref:Uncharacterized protein n=1 Tax=Teretinema zuelzerae TaxID=156 RepID=A0AAE3EG95_9SPIR|nr:hypothetical protein [Teretinema zuelzerae]MCD1654077.1 hypothetical protein [Teretinema zuelzerae]